MHITHQLQACKTRLPVRWRLALASFGLLVVLLSVLGALISFTVEQSLFTNEAIALHDEAQLAINDTKGHPLTFPTSLTPAPGPPTPAPGPAPFDRERAAKDLVGRLTSADVRVTVLSPTGTALASSAILPPVPLPVALDSTRIQHLLADAHRDNAYLVVNDSQGQRQLVVLLPLMRGQSTVALLQLNTSTASIDRSINTLHLILAVGIVGALAIAATVTLPLIGAALRPLVLMEQTSERIADGMLSARLDVPEANDEIGHLAHSFNRMVERLEVAFTRQKRFVSDASHELRTPLTALSGSMEMVLTGVDPSNVQVLYRLIRGMYTEVGRMQRLVEGLLALSRIDEGALVLRKEVINVDDVLDNVYEQAQRFASGQHICYEARAERIKICADADRLQQSLLRKDR